MGEIGLEVKGRLLALERKKRGLIQKQVAEKAFLVVDHYGKIERGKKRTPFDTLERIVDAINKLASQRGFGAELLDPNDFLEEVSSAVGKLQRSLEPIEVADCDTTTMKNGGNVGTIVGADTMRIELTIDRDYGTYSETDKQHLIEAIRVLLETEADLRVVRKKRGSVKLTLELPPAETERLLLAIRQGMLQAHGVIDASILEDFQKVRDSLEFENKLELSTDELDLSVRTRNCLEDCGVFTIGDLVNFIGEDGLNTSNFSERMRRQVYRALESVGFHRADLRRSALTYPSRRKIKCLHDEILNFAFSCIMEEPVAPQVFATQVIEKCKLLSQIKKDVALSISDPSEVERESKRILLEFANSIPEVLEVIMSDVVYATKADTAVKNDPRLTSKRNPGVHATAIYRFAHQFHKAGLTIIPRILSEQAKSVSAVEIHPGAKIGRSVLFENGVGVVIGPTAVVGRNCTIGPKVFWNRDLPDNHIVFYDAAGRLVVQEKESRKFHERFPHVS